MISFFSNIFRRKSPVPSAAEIRMERESQALREAHGKVREMYAAAKNYRLTGAWSPGGSDVNAIIRMSAPTVRARVRQLVRDFPYFARAAQVLSDFVVGEGIRFQSRIVRPDGRLDKELNQKTEDAFNFWAEKADLAGKLHYYEIMELDQRQLTECGEFFLVKHYPKKRFIPYALQVIEPDQLASDPKSRGKVRKYAEVDQGIEYDTRTGEIIAYHFLDAAGTGSAGRILAEDVIHGFRTLRPGQLRGISDFAPGVVVARDLADYMDAEIDGAKMAAKWLAFITRDSAMGGGGFPGMTTDDDGKMLEELENGVLEYLRPGEKIELATHNRPGQSFEPFVELILAMFSVATGVPYPLISGRYHGMNYNIIKAIRNDFQQTLRPKQRFMVRRFCLPTVRPFYDIGYMSGRLPYPPAFNSDPLRFYRAEWQPPGMEPADPLKEAKAKAEEMKTLTRSPQETARERGRDWEEILKEIQAATEMAADYGLVYDPNTVSTASASNPAAIDPDIGDE